jgi:hypothetical protein
VYNQTTKQQSIKATKMSGYRNLHREKILEDDAPIWQLQARSFSKSTDEWSVLSASADGIVRIFRIKEKEASNDLDASALSMTCTHALLGTNQVFPPPSQTLVGCSQCHVIRNYVGDDKMAGDIVIIALELTGRLRVWTLSDDAFVGATEAEPKQVRAQHEFIVENATGTLIAATPPNLSGNGDLTVAVACLDGSIAMVALGIATPSAKKEPSPVGTILDRWGSGSTPMSLCWHPTQLKIAIGRKDGLVEIISATKKGQHRLIHHSGTVRTVAYTPDGQLLIAGSDDGSLAVWDMNRQVPTIVHHVVNAHDSWILGVSPLADSRRFVTAGQDEKIHVWQLGTMHAPTHTFHIDQTSWTIGTSYGADPQRLVSGSDKGWIQVFSLDG